MRSASRPFTARYPKRVYEALVRQAALQDVARGDLVVLLVVEGLERLGVEINPDEPEDAPSWISPLPS